MPRIRSVHPCFALDEDLADLPDHVQLAHDRIPCFLDKAGRCEDKPRSLRAQVFPHRHEIDMEDVISKLAERNKLIRYEVEGKRYLQWVGFAEIHKPHHTEQPSKIPAPVNNVQSTVHTPCINGVPTVEAPLEHGQSLVSGLLSSSPLSLVDGRESQGDGGLSLASKPKAENREEQTGIVDELLPQLPVLYLEVKTVPLSGSVEKFRSAATDAIGTRPLSHLDRCVRIVRYALGMANAGRAYPFDREGFPNLFRNWSAFEESAVRNDIVTPIDPATGEPEPEWTDDCRATHPRLCLSRQHHEDQLRRDRERQVREKQETERAAAVEAAGGEAAFQAQQAAMRKEIWDRARNGAKAMAS